MHILNRELLKFENVDNFITQILEKKKMGIERYLVRDNLWFKSVNYFKLVYIIYKIVRDKDS